MSHRDIVPTPAAKNVLERMNSSGRDHVVNYIKNPFFQKAANEGAPLRLFAAGNKQGSWLEFSLDKNARVDIHAWRIQDDAKGNTTSRPQPDSVVELSVPFPLGRSSFATLEFNACQRVVSQMAFSAVRAQTLDDKEPFQTIINALGKHVPWVDQVSTLAHRVHGSVDGPHVLASVMKTMHMLADLVDEDVVHTAASPCTTAQALLAVHASAHASPEPGLYALDTPQGKTTYLFVLHQRLGTNSVNDQNMLLPAAPGAYVWLDGTGTPLFVNAYQNLVDPDAWFANQETLAWMPEEPKDRFGIRQTREDWNAFMRASFNAPTRAQCDMLVEATPRALGPEEALDVVQRWVHSTASTSALWEGRVSKNMLTPGKFVFARYTCAESLGLWAQYASDLWGIDYPTEHAVLQSLLPGMDTLTSIEQWRTRMAQMGPHGDHTQPEHIGLPDLREASDTTTTANHENDGPTTW